MPERMVNKFEKRDTRPGALDWAAEEKEVTAAVAVADARATGDDGKVIYPVPSDAKEDEMARAVVYVVGSGTYRVGVDRTGEDGQRASWFTWQSLVEDMEANLTTAQQKEIGNTTGLKNALIRLGQRGFITLHSARILIMHPVAVGV